MDNYGKDYCAIAKRYAEQVTAGEIPACRWVKLACERQLTDLSRKDWRWRFDAERGAKICRFIEMLPHIKGQWKTRNIQLEPWQCFILSTIFGWVDKEGVRRFRKALVVVPRKNAKSTKAAGIGLYLFALDNEPGAEVYSAATTRDQARISWDVARHMALRSPDFCRDIGVEPLAHSIAIENTASFYKPLSRDADSLEGLNVHGAIIDELHAHKTREVFDVLNNATGARRQPLLFIISTEGDSGEGVFAEQVEYAKGVLEGRHDDETYFGMYYTIDKGDDWTARESWIKANPNFGVSVFEHDMEALCREAKISSDSQASFLTKRLNVRVGAAHTYFNMLAWDRLCCDNTLKIEQFAEYPCIITLDLASKLDLTTKITVFRKGRDYIVFGKHYLPPSALQPGKPNYDFYRGWRADGLLTVSDESPERTDYELIERDLISDYETLRPLKIGVDPHYNAEQLLLRMEKLGLPMVQVNHNRQTFTEPMKDLEALILAGRIRHNGDPVLAWAMGNVHANKDFKEEVYPVKMSPNNKIDPAVALIANMSLQLREIDATPYYEREDAVV